MGTVRRGWIGSYGDCMTGVDGELWGLYDGVDGELWGLYDGGGLGAMGTV